VQETERSIFGLWQGSPIGTYGFEQAKSTDYVGLDEIFRPVDGAVDVTFGRKVYDGARKMPGEQDVYQVMVTYVTSDEEMPRIGSQADNVLQIACVRESVEVNNRFVALRKPIQMKLLPINPSPPVTNSIRIPFTIRLSNVEH
jgi:hypothetical protein